MVAANDINQRTEEIQMLIASDNVPQATKRLMDYVRDFSESKDFLNEVIVISATYNRLDKQERRSLINFDEAEKRRNRLLFQMLQLIEDIQDTLASKLIN